MAAVGTRQTGRLTLISSDGHASAQMADYRAYLDPEWREEFDAFLGEWVASGARVFDPAALSLRCDGVTLSAQAKGAGMIEPGFATMLCFVQTDAVLDDPDAALRSALAGSMERITVTAR